MQLIRPAATLHVIPHADEIERACRSAQLSFHPVTATERAVSMSATQPVGHVVRSFRTAVTRAAGIRGRARGDRPCPGFRQVSMPDTADAGAVMHSEENGNRMVKPKDAI